MGIFSALRCRAVNRARNSEFLQETSRNMVLPRLPPSPTVHAPPPPNPQGWFQPVAASAGVAADSVTESAATIAAGNKQQQCCKASKRRQCGSRCKATQKCNIKTTRTQQATALQQHCSSIAAALQRHCSGIAAALQQSPGSSISIAALALQH